MKQANSNSNNSALRTPAQRIRAELKKRFGYTSRDVSVRTSRGGSLNITVKNPGADFDGIKSVSICEQRIDRDALGEILCGGNTFVFVAWSTDARTERAIRYITEVEFAIRELESRGRGSSALVPICEGVMLGFDGYGYRVWREGGAAAFANTAECIAAIAADYADGFSG